MNSCEEAVLYSVEDNIHKILKVLKLRDEILRTTKAIRLLDDIQSSSDKRKYLLRGNTIEEIKSYQYKCWRRIAQRKELREKLINHLLSEIERTQ